MKCIAVIGDIMLDEYLVGKVSRISPEAPIPVVNTDGKKRYVLGGCGNVANNISALGIRADIFSIFGSDEAGQKLVNIMKEKSILFHEELVSNYVNTIAKQRIIGNGQQIVRIDCNDKPEITEANRKKLVELFESKAKEYDVVIISDYAKGVCDEYLCTTVIRICRENKIPVIVDPKGKNWGKYEGAFLITPNMKEICDFSGTKYENNDSAVSDFSKAYFEKIGIDNILVTRSEKGMSLFSNNGFAKHYRSLAKDVYDVSGAGDTVVASLAVFLVENDYDLDSAVDYANTAAGIVVGKEGTSVVTREEIEDERKGRTYLFTPVFKIDELDKLKLLISRWKNEGLSIVTTNGCFDIIHYGHVHLLAEAKKCGDKLVVCINSDESIKRLKGNDRPINSVDNRAHVLASIKYVDAVVVFDEMVQGESNSDIPYFILKTILPDVHVKGGDYSEEDVPESKYARKFVAINYIKDCSTTNTINNIKKRI